MLVNRVFTAAALAAALTAASGAALRSWGSPEAGLSVSLIAAVSAVFLLRRDSTPGTGTVFLVAALAMFSIQLWGGAAGPAGFLYPVLFLWMRRDSISGPALGAASAASVVEFLAPLSAAAGLTTGEIRVVSVLDSLGTALVAGIVPMLSLIAVDLLREDRRDSFAQPSAPPEGRSSQPTFPDDVARSLLPILKRATPAGGVFLFLNDDRGVFTLNEYIAGDGVVSSKYLAGPDDPVVSMLESARGDMVHTSADRLAVPGSAGLPWYVRESRCPFVSVLGFRRDSRLHGFLVLDFPTVEDRDSAAQVLVDSAFLISVAWERSRETDSTGFQEICEQMSLAGDIRGAVHRLISTVIRLYPRTTATVAVLGEGSVLRIFESIGSCSEGRAGKEFSVSDGFAGYAVKKKESLRRLRMGVGQKASGTYGETDESGRRAGSCCAVPLLDMNTVLGVLTVESENEQYFAPEDLSLFRSFATVFSLAVSRNGLMETLENLKQNDRITGLPLLSRFHAGLADMVRGVQSRAWSITVLAVDVHGFGKINGSWGFPAGDSVLAETAMRIRRAVGGDALLARSGADRFLVCLQCVDRVSAEAYAARIHEEFEAPVTFRGRSIPVKVAIGGAVSHVDRMIKRLPAIASGILNGLADKPGVSSITEVGQFYDADRS